jgi:hypothetical protein
MDQREQYVRNKFFTLHVEPHYYANGRDCLPGGTGNSPVQVELPYPTVVTRPQESLQTHRNLIEVPDGSRRDGTC